MKYLALLLFLPLLSASDCSKKNELPSCVQRVIDDAVRNEPSGVPVKIDEYLYNGKRVFLFTAPCCDQYNTVYDENCNAVCAPTGGITGKGDGNCTDFTTAATHVREVWKK